jgi:hypothetical protein
MIIIYLQVEHFSNALAFNIKTLLNPSENASANIANGTGAVGGQNKSYLEQDFIPFIGGRY